MDAANTTVLNGGPTGVPGGISSIRSTYTLKKRFWSQAWQKIFNEYPNGCFPYGSYASFLWMRVKIGNVDDVCYEVMLTNLSNLKDSARKNLLQDLL